MWNFINKCMCKLFMSCKITVAMLAERIALMLFGIIVINVYGFVYTATVGNSLTAFNIVTSGILFTILFIIFIF